MKVYVKRVNGDPAFVRKRLKTARETIDCVAADHQPALRDAPEADRELLRSVLESAPEVVGYVKPSNFSDPGLRYTADSIGYGGEVQSRNSNWAPPNSGMGSGYFGWYNWPNAAWLTRLARGRGTPTVFWDDYQYSPDMLAVDQPACYGAGYVGPEEGWGTTMYLGGPGAANARGGCY